MPKYRSNFEKELHKHVMSNLEYEPWRLSYFPVEKEYIPDFVNPTKKIIFEAKGYFRERAEASKYFPIIEAAKAKGYRFVIIFQHPHNKMPGVRKRKDGTFQTMSEWATKNNIEWYSYRNIPQELLNV